MTEDEKIEAQTLMYHGILNPLIWSNGEMKDDVRTALLAVANEFISTFGFDITVSDVVLTGSNCSYNWTAYSDLDIHCIVDMSSVGAAHKDFISEYLKIKKQLFNEHRKIKVKGYPCELYAQDKTELLVASGVFSLTNNKWIKKPTKSIPPKPNTQAIKAKVEDLTDQISDAIQQGNELSMLNLVKRLSDLRKSGLQTKGEQSVENLVFKVLRNNGTIARLRAAIEDSTDKKLTLESATLPFKLSIKAKHADSTWHHEGSNPDPSRPNDPNHRTIGTAKYHVSASGPSEYHIHDIHSQSSGGGKAALHHLTTSADKHRLSLQLHPKAYGENPKLNSKNLTDWYGRHGFEKTSQGMTRQPKKPITESVHHGPKAKAYKAKKKKYVSKHKGPSSKEGGLSSVDRWKKRRVAKLWAWKRAKGARLSREKPGSEKSISHRTYMAARNLTYKAILGKTKKSKLPYGARARAEKTAKRVYRLNIRNPENRVRYKYRRKDTTKRSGVSYKTP